VNIHSAEKALPAASPTKMTRNPLEDLKVDRVQYDTREGRVRLTLVKQCGEAKSSQTA
jgi:hypothetical protein